MGNRTFFKNVIQDKMSFQDIFSDVTRKHTPEETARVFIAGTELTTPREEEMLAGWQKPFLFARFFVAAILCVFLAAGIWYGMGESAGSCTMIVIIPFIMPVTLLLLVWEMNVPRTISLMEVLQVVGIGGVLSMVFALLLFGNFAISDASQAGLIEEPAKLAVIYLLLRKKNRKYILEGALLGVAVGTGFAVFESAMYAMSSMLEAGIVEGSYIFGMEYGIHVALIRFFHSLSGHGVFAGLYGAGLMMAKGAEPISPRHLVSVHFLKYFVLSIGIHALHNSGLLNIGLPSFFDGALSLEYLVFGVVAVYILMMALKKGVNEVVQICMDANGGRVTYAVNRDAGLPIMDIPAQTAIMLEGISGPYMGRKYQIGAGQSITIGRAAGKNGIELPACSNVSSVHCQVKAAAGKISIKDLGSTNGTYIGGQKLAPHQESFAGDGAIIYLGDKNCGFRVRV